MTATVAVVSASYYCVRGFDVQSGRAIQARMQVKYSDKIEPKKSGLKLNQGFVVTTRRITSVCESR
jgi:hypothetical protein